MAKDYFLYQVNKGWYRAYWSFLIACNLVMLGVFLASGFSTHATQYADYFRIGHTAAVMAGFNVLYLGVAFWLIAKYSESFAVLIGALLFLLLLLYGMANTSHEAATLTYTALWCISGFFIGMFGVPSLVIALFVTVIYVVLHSNFELSALTQASLVLAGGSLVMLLAAYFFWRTKFMNLQDVRMTQLSGALRNNQEQSEILIQSIADSVIVFDTEGKISLMNPAAAAMTEWPITEAMGVDAQLVAELTEEDGSDIPTSESPFTSSLATRQHINRTVVLTGRSGKKQTVSLVVSPVIAPSSNKLVGAVAVMRDISQEREAEKQRADFISTASHEMRTPVAAIEGYLALALNTKVSNIDDRARAYLEKAHTSTQHLGKLFQDLLTSSKAEDGRLSSHPAVVEMGAFTQQLTDDLKFAAEKKGLFAEFIIGASDTIDATAKDITSTHVIKPLYYVLADPDRMREVLTNLFDNACKYTEQGKISVGLTGDNQVVQLYVRDTGNGIPAEDIPHLFQKFYRVDNSATRTIGGTGLGLFICRKIVELYHGRIWVESELGKGSTFFINLPRLSAQRAAELQQQEQGTTLAATPAASPLTAADAPQKIS